MFSKNKADKKYENAKKKKKMNKRLLNSLALSLTIFGIESSVAAPGVTISLRIGGQGQPTPSLTAQQTDR